MTAAAAVVVMLVVLLAILVVSREAIAIDARAEHKAFVGFFLGEALAATGANEAARAAWHAAAAACADSRYAQLARERAATVAIATPYR